MFILFRLLKTYIRNPSLLFIFHPHTCLEMTMLSTRHTHIFTRWRLFFPSFQQLSHLLSKYWRSIFNVFANNQIWQLDLANNGNALKRTMQQLHNSRVTLIPNLHQEPWVHLSCMRNSSLLFVHPPTWLGTWEKRRCQPRSRRVYFRVGRWVLPHFFLSWFVKLLEVNSFDQN
jgi:hypothetical protein